MTTEVRQEIRGDAAGGEIVADPVSHISISGVHGGTELNERLLHPARRGGRSDGLRTLLLGAAIGAVAMYLLKR